MKQTSSKLSLKRALVTGGILTLGLGVLLAGLIACSKDDGTNATTTAPNNDDNPPVTVAGGPYYSPSAIAVSEDGKWIYVGGATDEAIYRYSAEDYSLTSVYETDSPVNSLTVSGDKVYAGMGKLGGELVVLSSDLKEEGSVVVGHTPNDVVIKGTTAYVANRFSCTVSVVDLTTMTETKEIPVSREPMAMAVVGDKLYVANHLPEDNAVKDSVSPRISVIDTKKNEVSTSIALCNGAANVKDIVASPDGKTLYLSHSIARYTYPTTQLDGGWIYTNGISVVTTSNDKLSYTFLLDDVELGAGNPWGLGLNAKGTSLFVAISGSGELMKVDLTKLNQHVSRVGTATGVVDTKEEIVNYIPFAKNCKSRAALGGEGVRSIAVIGDIVYCAQYFSGNVVAVNGAGTNMKTVAIFSPGTQPEADTIRLGEALWYDSTICYQNWQSCASCHPDGRADGFNWDNLNDGVGVSKQAKSMLYSLRTPPVMVIGIRPDGETAIGAGLKYICFNADTEGIVEGITAYLMAMLPEQSPYLNDDGTLTESATRGKALFNEFGCVTCHPAPLYTDMQFHTSIDLENEPAWEYRDMDTSSLVEIWRTYPWGYFGGHTDMVEYVKTAVKKAGKTISDEQAKDLANFILSIGAEGEQYGANASDLLVQGTNVIAVSALQHAGGYEMDLSLYVQSNVSSVTGNTTAQFSLEGTPVLGKRMRKEFPLSYLVLTGSRTSSSVQWLSEGSQYINYISSMSKSEILNPSTSGAAKSKLIQKLRGGHGNLSEAEIQAIACWIDLCIPCFGSYYSREAWDGNDVREYEEELHKRELYDSIDRWMKLDRAGATKGTGEIKLEYITAKNKTYSATGEGMVILYTTAKYSANDKIVITLPKGEKYLAMSLNSRVGEAIIYCPSGKFTYTMPNTGSIFPNTMDPGSGINYQSQTITARVVTAEELAKKHNLALNPYDLTSASGSYPHASTSNVNDKNLYWEARCAIDGFTANEGHGEYPYQSWGPNDNVKATDHFTIDFGREVTVDELVVVIRADFPHDSYFTGCTVTFSNGTSKQINLTNSALEQVIDLGGVKTSSIKLSGFTVETAGATTPYAALTEVKVMGTEVKK